MDNYPLLLFLVIPIMATSSISLQAISCHWSNFVQDNNQNGIFVTALDHIANFFFLFWFYAGYLYCIEICLVLIYMHSCLVQNSTQILQERYYQDHLITTLDGYNTVFTLNFFICFFFLFCFFGKACPERNLSMRTCSNFHERFQLPTSNTFSSN